MMSKFFVDEGMRKFCYKIAFLCATSSIFGIILLSLIKNTRYNLSVTALSLIALGIVMIFIEKITDGAKKVNNIKNITWKQNLCIGLMQALSLIPGISRSGSTVCGGMLSGVDKKTAIKYSFFVSIPMNILSCAFDIYKKYDIIFSGQRTLLILLIIMLNFIFSLFFIKKILKFFEETNLKFFGYYRLLMGLIIFGVIK
jgi:undecaprenyl-diphosphatase